MPLPSESLRGDWQSLTGEKVDFIRYLCISSRFLGTGVTH